MANLLLLGHEPDLNCLTGEATVKNLFEFHKKKDKFTIAGCMVTSGSVHKDSLSRIIRNNEVIAEGKNRVACTIAYFSLV